MSGWQGAGISTFVSKGKQKRASFNYCRDSRKRMPYLDPD
jgi:hypothetical protein